MRLVVVHFFGFRGACARSDAIGPRSRFGVLGLRRSLPACDASRLDVVIVSPFYRLLLTRLRVNKKRNLGGFCEEAVDSGRNRWMVVHKFRCSDFVPSHMGLGCSSWAYPDLRPGLLYAPPSGLGFGGVGATFGASSRATQNPMAQAVGVPTFRKERERWGTLGLLASTGCRLSYTARTYRRMRGQNPCLRGAGVIIGILRLRKASTSWAPCSAQDDRRLVCWDAAVLLQPL